MPADFYSYNAGTMGAIAGGVQAGVKFSAAHTPVSWSFPTAESQYPVGSYGVYNEQQDFLEMLSGQKTAGRWAMQLLGEYLGKTFSAEVTETDSIHGDIRGARTTNAIGGGQAHGYYPTIAAMGANNSGSDFWLKDSVADAAIGNFAWLTVLHEIGHAMGLKHAHETSGTFPVMPTANDCLEYTVMAYKSYPGASVGYVNSYYPQTYMSADIEALQQMYGANTAIRTGSNTIVHFNPTTGQISVNGTPWLTPSTNKIWALLPWANTTNYTLDCSSYTTNLAIDISPGAGSILSATQLAGTGGSAPNNVAQANIWVPRTGLLPTRVIVGTGNNTLVGNSATNTLVLSGARAAYTAVDNGDGTYTLTKIVGGSVNTIYDFNFVEFSDETVAVENLDATPPGPGYTLLTVTVTT